MQKIKRELLIKDFVENTTFHGVFYVKTPHRAVKVIWLLTVLVSASLIILSTVLMINKYLKYEYYIINEQRKVDKIENIPNLLVCSSRKLSLVDSIIDFMPDLNESFQLLKHNSSYYNVDLNTIIDDEYLKEVKQFIIDENRYNLVKCEIHAKNKVIDCSNFKKEIVFTFNGFCLLLSFQEIKQLDHDQSLLNREVSLLNFNDESKIRITVKFNGSVSSHDMQSSELNNIVSDDTSFPSGSLEPWKSLETTQSEEITTTESTSHINALETTRFSESFTTEMEDAQEIFENLSQQDEEKKPAESLNFMLVTDDSGIYSNLNDELVFSRYVDLPSVKYYNIIPTFIRYSTTLNKRKCKDSNGYDESRCNYECLQEIIKKELRCNFVFNFKDSIGLNLPYCRIGDLFYIEKIIEEFSYWKDYYKICEICLPGCDHFKYETNEIVAKGDLKTLGFVWNFYLDYKTNEIKYIESFGQSELLNFINGLWSLFLGISVLSLWEIVELIYGIINRNGSKYLNKIDSVKFKKTEMAATQQHVSKFVVILKKIFHDTYLHGFKNLFGKKHSKAIKIRWFVIILLATVGFSIAIKDAISEYLKYNSNIEQTIQRISNDDVLKNRKLEFFVCKPLALSDEVQKNKFTKLNSLANDLFEKNNISLHEIIKEYREKAEDFNLLERTEYISILELYNKTFPYKQLPIYALTDNSKKSKISNTNLPKYYYNKVCVDVKFNVTLDRWVQDEFKVTHRGFNKIEFDLSIDPDYKIDIYIIDAQSYHITEKSWYTSLSITTEARIPNVKAHLKYKKLLQSPFRPSCNQQKRYKQHECLRECFNDIIYKAFGCRVIFGDGSEQEEYCHPWMIPLIINYEKYVLKSSSINQCEHCKEPCEFFTYDLELRYEGVRNFVSVSDIHEKSEQKSVLTLKDTIIVIISYFSLFYGASILAFIQLLFNTISNSSIFNDDRKIELNYLRKLSAISLLSNSTTLHCVKYLSSKTNNDIRKLFWLIIICLSVIGGVVYCVIEVGNYQKSKPVSHTVELDNPSKEELKIDICKTVLLFGDLYPKSKNNANDEIRLAFSHVVVLSYEFDFEKHNTSLKESIEMNFHEFNQNLLSIDHIEKVMEIKLSGQLFHIINKNLNSAFVFNGIDWLTDGYSKITDFNFKETVYETSLLYYYGRLNLVVCKTVNFTLFQNSSLTNSQLNDLHNPFIKLSKNQFSYYNSRYLDIYLENFILETSQFSKENEMSKRIKGLYKNYDYKYACIDKINCIFSQRILQNFTEHQLFLCNSELKEAIFKVLNCTPFMSHTQIMPECPAPYLFFIYQFMSEFKKDLFKCEFSPAKHPVQFDEFMMSSTGLPNDDISMGIDFNGVKIYEQKIEEEYDLLELVVNLSNWLNVLIGFSFITLCEILFIFVYYKCSSKVSPANIKN